MKIVLCMFALAAVTMADETDLQEILTEGNNQFTSRMFTEVVKEKPNTSVVLSAFSVLSPLAQLALGSVGESHDQLLNAIGLPNDNVTKSVFSDLTRQLRAVKGVEMKIANKIYITLGAELNDQYAVVSRDVFDSDVQNVDFTKSEATAKEINTWVEDQTNHRIKNLVDPDSLDGSTSAVLVNAIYFKGSWKDKFNKAYTIDRDFHVTTTKTIKVPTMYKQGFFLYGEIPELNAKIVELPYEGEQSSLLLVVPYEIEGITALQMKLKDAKVLENALKNLRKTELDLFMPKFNIETTTNLKAILQKMGVNYIFQQGKAQLDNLMKGTNNLYVSDAVQKASIEVNEDGAEAAAANEFGISYLSAVISETPVFNADRPFVFYLREEKNTLFSGAYHA